MMWVHLINNERPILSAFVSLSNQLRNEEMFSTFFTCLPQHLMNFYKNNSTITYIFRQ